MQTKRIVIGLAFGALVLTSCSMMPKDNSSVQTVGSANSAGGITQQPLVKPEILSRYTTGWPDSSVKAAKNLLAKYGEPTESTASMLVWKGIAPFKRIVVYREEVVHRFPLLHKDLVEHVVAYKIPINKAGELTKFDGSVIFDRTRGELSARNEDEAMNLLALNLANEIMTGKRTASSARTEYGKIALDYLNGNKNVLTQGLLFINQTNTADADQSSKFNFAQAQEEHPASHSSSKDKKALLKQAQEELAQ